MKRLLAFLLASALSLTTGAYADPATDQRPINVRIELQVVAVPEAIAVPLAAEMMKKDKIEAAYVKIQELLAKGTAKLIGWPIVTTVSGQRAVSEAIHEVRFTTEYSPPTVNLTPNVPANATIKIAPSVDVTAFAGIPAAFETRNVGVTLEVEPSLSVDGKTINLNIVPQDVRLRGFNKVTMEVRGGGGKVVVEQPEFDVKKLTTSLTVRNGERVLLGVYPTDEPPKHIEFFILKAEAIPVE